MHVANVPINSWLRNRIGLCPTAPASISVAETLTELDDVVSWRRRGGHVHVSSLVALLQKRFCSLLMYSINGIPACANRKLLTDIVRKEWGFDGYVISDEGAIELIMVGHNYTNSVVDTVAAAVNAGAL
jgi:Glycosyl hydrolase family 3 N terminal domain